MARPNARLRATGQLLRSRLEVGLMTADQFLGQVGRIAGYIGFAFVIVAFLKYFGVQITALPGDPQLLAILGFALRSLR